MASSSSSSSPYPWPSALNVANFVTVKPCVDGEERSHFNIWRKQMLCLLQSQGLLGFVDGSILLPLDTHHQHLWRRTDALIQGWILGSIGKHALRAVWENQTAMDLWLELERIFDGKRHRGDFSRYLDLYLAVQRGDCFTALNFFSDVNELGKTIINSNSETALHVAVKTGGKANDLVKKLVEFLSAEALAVKQSNGDTVLHYAAMVGNTEAAMALVDRSPDLLYTLNNKNRSPVLEAAVHSQKKTLQYLISLDYDPNSECNPFKGQLGIHLLNTIIASELLDMALDLVTNHPNLALLVHDGGDSALSTIAQMETLFTRTECFTWCQKLIYNRVPTKEKDPKSEAASTASLDIEDLSCSSSQQRNYSTKFKIISVLQKVESRMWDGLKSIVPEVRELRDKKARHEQALHLARYFCQKIISFNGKEASNIFEKAIIKATKYGISEIVEMIMLTYPMATSHIDAETGRNVFLLAASYRFENVINLFYNMSDHRYMFYDNTDHNDNNLMHICAKLSPPTRLNLASGAALQMQRELQWFKEMGNFVSPSRRSCLNKDRQTPQMIFTKEHAKLKADGERWMKDTANAGSITAALIVTIMFAAAFTIPGGVDSHDGTPLFKDQIALDVFAHSDAISLFSSIFALLMFLSILTSRYAEEDFLYVLPQRLTLGLLSLFVSITSVMVAFCVTIYLFFRKEGSWFIVPLSGFAGLPVTAFVLLQFPLLLELLSSTYGPGIFGKRTHTFIY